MSNAMRTDIIAVFYVTFCIRVCLIGLFLMLASHIDVNMVKIPIINLLVFVFIIYALEVKNLEQIILFKIFSVFSLIKLLMTVYLLKFTTGVSKYIIVLAFLYVLSIVVDGLVAKMAYDALYIDFTRNLTHNIGFSLYRKRLFDIRQNIRLGLIMYTIDCLFTELTCLKVGYNKFNHSYILLKTIFNLVFIIIITLLHLSNSSKSAFFSILILILNLILELSALIIEFSSKQSQCRLVSVFNYFVVYSLEYLLILLYILYYTIKKLIYICHLENIERY